MPAFSILRACLRDDRGTALIETAVVAPVLIVLAIGTFETSSMVARQSELQSAAEQAVEIALATAPDTQAELNAIKAKVEESTGLNDARVQIKFQYRCGAATTVSDVAPSCSEDALNTYFALAISDEYQPTWTNWGFGQSIEYAVNRTVQVS